MLVALVGSCLAPDSELQVDFGVDVHGKEILTVTNLDESIWCIGKGILCRLLAFAEIRPYTLCTTPDAALLVTHRLVLRYLSAMPHKAEYTANVVIYHPTIWKQILAAAEAVRVEEGLRARFWQGPALAVPALGLPALAVAVPAARTPASLHYGRVREGYKEKQMRDFPKGAEVVVVGALKAYAEFIGMHGVVVLTVQQHHRVVCIRLESQGAREAVQRLNAVPRNKQSFAFLKDDELDLLCCKVGQVTLRDGGGQDTTRLGKRKASEDSS